MEGLKQLLGVPEECQPINKWASDEDPPPPPALIAALEAAAADLAAGCELQIAQLVVRLIEEPAFRLAGAEEAIRQLGALVEQALGRQEQLGQELQERSVTLYQRVRQLLEQTVSAQTPASGWKSPAPKKGSPPPLTVAEMTELLRSYAKCRYQGLILHKINAFYVGLRGQLSDQMREVDFCRARLGELREMMGDERPGQAAPTDDVLPLAKEAGTYLLPDGCASLPQAVKRVDETITAEELQVFDGRIQQLIQKQFRALVHVCTSPSSLLRSLAPRMRQEAEAFLEGKVGGDDLAETYLARQEAGGPNPPEDMATAFDLSAPEQGGQAEELCVLALPPSVAEQRFRQMANEAVPEARLTAADSGADEIVLYRERLAATPLELTGFGPAEREAYKQASSQGPTTPHSRLDIAGW
jgi:hypothetical protein